MKPLLQAFWPACESSGPIVYQWLQDYGKACYTAGLEDAAQACEEIKTGTYEQWRIGADTTGQSQAIGAGECADAIRALKKGQP